MATKKHATPPGLDYAPLTGTLEDVSFGVIQATPGGTHTHTAHGWRLIHRRLDDAWGAESRKSWTIGQVFRPKTEQHARVEADLH